MASNHVNIKNFRELPGGLVSDVWEFPAVRSINKYGKELSWQVRVWVDDAGVCVPVNDSWFDSGAMPYALRGVIAVVSGMVGGKVRDVDNTYVVTGKNLGKISATNVWTQALRDALGMYNKKLQKATVQDVAEAPGEPNAPGVDAQAAPCKMYPPMLAKVIGDIPDGLAYVQPKLNGVRAVAVLCRDKVIMYSRRSKEYPALSHIKQALAKPLWTDLQIRGSPVYLDGEIYKHGARLQDISGATRRESADTRDLAFHVYDCFVLGSPDLVFSERQKVLDDVFLHIGDNPAVVRVETLRAETPAMVREFYEKYLAEEYEGAMHRLDLPYDFSYNERHSSNLLKMKPNFDGEYEITGWTTGRRGKAADAIMIECKTTAGKMFSVTPAMTIALRRALAKKMAEIEPNGKTHFENQWLGKPLIVTYDELSADNVPQRGRTEMVIRTWD